MVALVWAPAVIEYSYEKSQCIVLGENCPQEVTCACSAQWKSDIQDLVVTEYKYVIAPPADRPTYVLLSAGAIRAEPTPFPSWYFVDYPETKEAFGLDDYSKGDPEVFDGDLELIRNAMPWACTSNKEYNDQSFLGWKVNYPDGDSWSEK